MRRRAGLAFACVALAGCGGQDAASSDGPLRPISGNARRGSAAGGPVSLYRGSSAPSDVHPLRGAVVPPRGSLKTRESVEIPLYMRATKPGRYAYDGFWLSYRDGDDERRVRVPSAFGICLARDYDTATRRRCPSVRIPSS